MFYLKYNIAPIASRFSALCFSSLYFISLCYINVLFFSPSSCTNCWWATLQNSRISTQNALCFWIVPTNSWGRLFPRNPVYVFEVLKNPQCKRLLSVTWSLKNSVVCVVKHHQRENYFLYCITFSNESFFLVFISWSMMNCSCLCCITKSMRNAVVSIVYVNVLHHWIRSAIVCVAQLKENEKLIVYEKHAIV